MGDLFNTIQCYILPQGFLWGLWVISVRHSASGLRTSYLSFVQILCVEKQSRRVGRFYFQPNANSRSDLTNAVNDYLSSRKICLGIVVECKTETDLSFSAN